MPRRERPTDTRRSEHWLRVAANEAAAFTSEKIRSAFGWVAAETIEWRSPVESDQHAEYYDEAFLEWLGIEHLAVPLHSFWPPRGPRWDGLARTSSGKFLVFEAKAYIEEGVDFRSKAGSASLERIAESLEQSKRAPERAPVRLFRQRVNLRPESAHECAEKSSRCQASTRRSNCT